MKYISGSRHLVVIAALVIAFFSVVARVSASTTIGPNITTGGTLSVTGSSTLSDLTVTGTCTGCGGGSQWTTSGSEIYFQGGNVGINTTAPASLLDVNGNANISGNLTIGATCPSEAPSAGTICPATVAPQFIQFYDPSFNNQGVDTAHKAVDWELNGYGTGGLLWSIYGDPSNGNNSPLTQQIIASTVDRNTPLLNPSRENPGAPESYWFLNFNKAQPGVGPSSPAQPGLAGDVLVSWAGDYNVPFLEIDTGPRPNYGFTATMGLNVTHPQAAIDARTSDPALPAAIFRENPFQSAQTADLMYFTAGDGHIGPAVFSGSGLNDAFFNDPTTPNIKGAYTGALSQTMCVKIASVAPDTVVWGNNGACDNINDTPVAIIAGADRFLGQGVNITFASDSGHTVGDKWSTSLVPDTKLAGITKDGGAYFSGGSDGHATCWKGTVVSYCTSAVASDGTCACH